MTDTVGTVKRAGAREWAALVVLTLTVIMLAIDNSVLALAVPALTADLEPTPTQILWIGDIYSFALAGLLVTMGNVADRIGRKRLLMIGSIGFGIASAIAAFAPTAELLIIARAFLGISGATIMPSTLSIVRNIFDDPKQRARAIAIWAAGITAGAAAGPVVGGLLLENFWWGSVFLINLPVIVLVLVLGAFLLPESRNPERAPIDFVSSLLAIAAIVPFIYAVKTIAYDGFSLLGIAALLIGVLSGYVFVRRQKRLTHPLIDIKLFKVPAFTGAIIAETIAIFAFIGMIFLLSQYLQLGLGFSALEAGLIQLPATIAAVAVIVVIGKFAKLGLGRAIALGMLIASAGMFVLAATRTIDGLIPVGIALALLGLGSGIASTLATDAIVSAVPKTRAGAASSIAETGYELGIALGIAILGTIQTLFYRAFLTLPTGVTETGRDAAHQSLADALHAADTTTPEGQALADAARQAFETGMIGSALIAGALYVTAAIVALRVIKSAPGHARVEH